MNIGDIVQEKDYTESAIFCNDNDLCLIEIEKDDSGRRFLIVKNEKSDGQTKQEEIDALKFYLRDTDWIIVKIAEKRLNSDEKGVDEDLKKYAETLKQRATARARINELEKEEER